MTLCEFLSCQRESFIREMRSSYSDHSFMTLPQRRIEQFVAAKNMEWNKLICDSEGFYVAVFQSPEPQLWARSTARGYRKAFARFLVDYWNCKDSIPSDLHVDHIDPSFKFGNATAPVFLRLALVPGPVNVRYGAGFERPSNQHNKSLSFPSGNNLTYTAFCKVVGHNVPKADEGREAWEAWVNTGADLLIGLGIEQECMKSAVRNVLKGEVEFRFRETNITHL